MRVVFMGTPDFSVGTLEALIASKHEVCAVVTQPDKPRGRGKAVQFTPVKEVAVRENIPVYQPKKVRDPEFVETLRGLGADVIVVVAFGQIIPQSILDLTKYGCINVHASLLPRHRGASCIQAAIEAGDDETGITVMHVVRKLDAGDIICQAAIPLNARAEQLTLPQFAALADALADHR